MTSAWRGLAVRWFSTSARPTREMTHRAEWNGKIIAESDKCESVEGNWYFPPSSIKKEYFAESTHTSVCGWKGTANYAHIVVDGKRNENAAWIYKTPKTAAANITGYWAFWKGVKVV
eukprot:TRINITY_DN101859_c0_g1_i1.p1 TRINITY_DN101859_c0_g1~~TRINITY_DN101859_c0_g1_i1.p1  ORF type:complete len:117 (+),score=16.41 TRINITY_DN101859_c0_g1_i1:61-411(+)